MHQIISINIQWISNVERNEEVFDIQTKTHLLWHIYNQYQTIWPLLVPGLECWPPRPGPSPSSPPPSPSWPGWQSRRRSPGAAGPPPVHRTVLYMRDERGHAVIMFNQQFIHPSYPCWFSTRMKILLFITAHRIRTSEAGKNMRFAENSVRADSWQLTALFPTSVLFSMKRLMRVVLPTPRSPTTYTRHVFSTLITSQG